MESVYAFEVETPGRLCLFGEHSDYIGLDVIPAAIDLKIKFSTTLKEEKVVNIDYRDLGTKDSFKLDQDITYSNKRDYVRSAFNVVKRKYGKFTQGCDITVRGDIPMAAGLSSSSALSLAAVMTAALVSGTELGYEERAELAWTSEVAEFGESGGKQDHYASSFGGIVHLDLGQDYKVTRLPAEIHGLVIGDSLEMKKDTVADIRWIKETVESEYRKLSEKIEGFDHRTTPVNHAYGLSRSRPSKERSMAEATLRNRDLTARAFDLLSKKRPDTEELGEMFDEHHEILRDGLHRSTQKIEMMIQAAKEAGALGCKINGSGGGGTMTAYAPGAEDQVVEAIERAGGKAYKVGITGGAIRTLFYKEETKIEPR